LAEKTKKEIEMKRTLAVFTIALLAASGTFAEETTSSAPGPIGIGYQGAMIDGDFANQISLRYAPKPIGGALVFSQMTDDNRDGGDEVDLWTLEAKGFYSLIQRENSDFYVGGSLGYLNGDTNGGDEDAWTFGALLGVEWYFNELPEVGFNFEVGYKAAMTEYEDDDNNALGTYVSVGAHYYF
jgi:hypothetical protein